MEQALLKLRDDLVCSKQTTPDGVAFILKDPVRGEFFRLKEAEGYIAEQLDGNTAVDELHARIEKEFDAVLPRETLTSFIKDLDRNGLLENERGANARQARKRPRFAGSALYFRIRLYDPERLLDWLITRAGFLFTRGFMYLSASVIFAAVCITIFNWRDIAFDGAQMYKLSTLPLLVMVVFLVGTAHEFAHGLTCKHFGGEVRDMGFLLLYMQPALYCNVSDAWLFEEKSKRLWVAFAGPWFELFLGAVATLIWRVTAHDAAINHLALIVMVSAGVKTLLNFNPLIKLDGYYLLSDYLEIPNLRKRAFSYIGDVMRRLGGTLDHLPEVTPKERKVFLSYGLVGIVGSLVIFTYTSLLLGQLLIVDQQRMAFGLFTGLVGFRYRQYGRRLFGHAKKGSVDFSHNLLHALRDRRGLVVKSSFAGSLLLLLMLGRVEQTVSGPIAMLPRRNADVRTQVTGDVARVLVHEGEFVKKGQVIARLSDRNEENTLQQILAQIRQKRAILDQLEAGPRKHQIAVARQDVTSWTDQLAFARAKRERIEALYKKHMMARSDFDAARETEVTARNNLDQSNAKLKLLLDGVPPQQIRAAKAVLAGLEDQRKFLEGQLRRLDVTSPAKGIVTTPTRQLVELSGQVIPKGGLIAKVYDVDIMTVLVAVSEKDIGSVKVGQRIGVKVRAYPGRIFFGTVTEIGTTTEGATSLPTSAVTTSQSAASSLLSAADTPTANIVVTTRIENHNHLLKPGMTGIAKVYCGRRHILDLLMRQLSRTVRVEFWSWW